MTEICTAVSLIVIAICQVAKIFLRIWPIKIVHEQLIRPIGERRSTVTKDALPSPEDTGRWRKPGF